MKKKIISLCFSLLVLLSIPTFAQGPGEPYHPMTVNGAKGISRFQHTLFWKNPIGTIYNKVYLSDDSILVANSNNSVLLYDGYPSTVYSSVSLNIFGYLEFYKDYYWKVVEYGVSDSTCGNVWNFKSRVNPMFMTWFEDDFGQGLSKWTITNDGGSSWCIWSIHNATNYSLPTAASGNVLAADVNDCGGGSTLLSTATLITPIDLSGYPLLRIEFDNDWNVLNAQDEAHVEISTNRGNTWNGVWDQIGVDIRNTHEQIDISAQGIFTDFLVRFRSVQPGWDWWWAIDNVKIDSYGLLTPPDEPNLLTAIADSSELIINLQWTSGWCVVNPPSGYEIFRKNGLPLDTTSYSLLTTINSNLLNFVDDNVLPNEIYTYKIRTKCESVVTIWGNEATAYVPNIVPVELQSFTSEVLGSNAELLWSTATETNNSGFEILRSTQNDNTWENIGFVPGLGTTTEVHNYTFVDEGLQSGNYQYRLKQIDFDGTFEYLNIIEVTIDAPTKFSLEQNYPNPFNPTTKIKFSIPSVETHHDASLQVTLKVYDVLGNEVVTLVNEQKQPGAYEIEFDGMNLPSGIYFYQLKAGSFVETKKMVLMK